MLHVVKTMLVKRRLGLTKVTKMKGHATGFWSGWDKAGNDEADSAADLVTKRVLVRAIDSRASFCWVVQPWVSCCVASIGSLHC